MLEEQGNVVFCNRNSGKGADRAHTKGEKELGIGYGFWHADQGCIGCTHVADKDPSACTFLCPNATLYAAFGSIV